MQISRKTSNFMYISSYYYYYQLQELGKTPENALQSMCFTTFKDFCTKISCSGFTRTVSLTLSAVIDHHLVISSSLVPFIYSSQDLIISPLVSSKLPKFLLQFQTFVQAQPHHWFGERWIIYKLPCTMKIFNLWFFAVVP